MANYKYPSGSRICGLWFILQKDDLSGINKLFIRGLQMQLFLFMMM